MQGEAYVLINPLGGRIYVCPIHGRGLNYAPPESVRDIVRPNDRCWRCMDEKAERELPGKVEAALLSDRFAYTRVTPSGLGVVIYHRDDKSPTGVRANTWADEATFNAVYGRLVREGKIGSDAAPLSPTEGRRTPGCR